MELKISIDAPELSEALSDLAGAIRVLSASGNCVSELLETAMETNLKELEAVTEEEPEKTETPQSKAVSDAPTVVELRAKAKEKGSTPEGKRAVRALLDKFKSKAVSDVPEGKRAAFLAALEEL